MFFFDTFCSLDFWLETTDFEGICLICRLWGRLSLQVREEFGEFLGIGRKPPYLCIDKRKDIKFNNLK